jgi:hypothetical protein
MNSFIYSFVILSLCALAKTDVELSSKVLIEPADPKTISIILSGTLDLVESNEMSVNILVNGVIWFHNQSKSYQILFIVAFVFIQLVLIYKLKYVKVYSMSFDKNYDNTGKKEFTIKSVVYQSKAIEVEKVKNSKTEDIIIQNLVSKSKLHDLIDEDFKNNFEKVNLILDDFITSPQNKVDNVDPYDNNLEIWTSILQESATLANEKDMLIETFKNEKVKLAQECDLLIISVENLKQSEASLLKELELLKTQKTSKIHDIELSLYKTESEVNNALVNINVNTKSTHLELQQNLDMLMQAESRQKKLVRHYKNLVNDLQVQLLEESKIKQNLNLVYQASTNLQNEIKEDSKQIVSYPETPEKENEDEEMLWKLALELKELQQITDRSNKTSLLSDLSLPNSTALSQSNKKHLSRFLKSSNDELKLKSKPPKPERISKPIQASTPVNKLLRTRLEDDTDSKSWLWMFPTTNNKENQKIKSSSQLHSDNKVNKASSRMLA